MPDNTGSDIVATEYGLDVGGLFSLISQFFFGANESEDGGLIALLWTLFTLYSVLAFLASALFLFGFIYAKIRLTELWELRDKAFHDAEHQFAEEQHETKNKRWEDAVAHIESDNPNDWRLAIIEADIMLEDLLDTLGYAGMTIGDKLKRASPQFFRTLDDAWRAHRTRNEIAHKGSDFILTKRVAKETLEQYRRVFVEFGII